MTYFTSDEHFWHANVIKYCSRPHASVEDMNEDMIKKWNSVVKPEDTVYCLGDFSMAFRSVELYSFRLNGIKYLIPGNHDMCHSYHKKSRSQENREKWIQKYKDYGWTVLPEQTTLDIGGLTVNICHHPYTTKYETENEDKYTRWRPNDDGKILLCGHIHEKWKVNKSIGGTFMINVGVDQWDFTPVSAEKIFQMIKDGLVQDKIILNKI